MIQVIFFEEYETDYKVGFTQDGFIVYGMISKESTDGMTKEQILQKIYAQIKHSMDYEKGRVDAGKEPSIKVNGQTGETFNPDAPYPARLEFKNMLNIVLCEDGQDCIDIPVEVSAYDQYGDLVSDEVTLTASNGILNGPTLSIPSVKDVMDVEISASCGSLTQHFRVKVYPAIPQSDPNTLLASELDSLKRDNEMLKVMIADLGLMVGGGI